MNIFLRKSFRTDEVDEVGVVDDVEGERGSDEFGSDQVGLNIISLEKAPS